MRWGTKRSLQTLNGKTHPGRYFVVYREQMLCFNQDREIGSEGHEQGTQVPYLEDQWDLVSGTRQKPHC